MGLEALVKEGEFRCNAGVGAGWPNSKFSYIPSHQALCSLFPFFLHVPPAACPEKVDRIDEMMIKYSGYEEVLIGHLSTMLAAKN